MLPSERHRPQPKIPLTELPAGTLARVCALEGGADVCQRLREIGFGETALVEKISGDHTLLCRICGIRIALSQGAARHIVVEPLGHGS